MNNEGDYIASEIFNEEPYTVGYDNVFNMDLFYFEENASFNQLFKLVNKDLLQGNIEGQAAN